MKVDVLLFISENVVKPRQNDRNMSLVPRAFPFEFGRGAPPKFKGKSPGNEVATCQRRLLRNMMPTFGLRVVTCCDMLGVVGSSLKMVKFWPTTPNIVSFIRFRDDDRIIFAKIFEGFPFFFTEYMFLLREVI